MINRHSHRELYSLPLQIYLDSSDFSNLSSSSYRPEYSEIERQLNAWRDNGQIEIRYSYTHVMEAAPTDPKDVDSASRRLRKIYDLCQGKCIVYLGEIIESEIRALCQKNKKQDYRSIYNNDGDWIPDISTVFDDISAREIVTDELLKTGLNRSTRRRLMKSFFDSKGKAKPALKRQLAETEAGLLEEIMTNYPLTETESKILFRYLFEKRYKEEATIVLVNSVKDLNRLASWYKKRWKETSKISKFLRETGNGLKRSLEQSATNFEVLSNVNKMSYIDNDLERQRDKSFRYLLQNVTENYVSKLAKHLSISCDNGITKTSNAWSLIPSIKTVTTIAAYTGKRSAMHPGSNRSPKTSDFGDLMHAHYLPHVDIYRTDGFMASVIREAKLPFDTSIVGKFNELPDVIENRLENRK